MVCAYCAAQARLACRLGPAGLPGTSPAYAPDRDAARELRQRISMLVGTSSAVIA
jgi:hypothetical protein